jgi:GH15 family glucan-1,4-alpha-glucosidase
MKNYDSYCIIGNCTTAALISSDCSIEWLCLPFFDSPSLFARILDEEKGGYFKISGVDTVKTYQSYIYRTNILKTVFETKHGIFEIRDYMPRFHTFQGQVYYPPEIHRNIRVISGIPQIIVEFKPMPNYALGEPRYILGENCVEVISEKGDYDNYFLYTNLDTRKVIEGVPIELKESSFFLLSYHEKLQDLNLHKIYVEYEKTKSYWLDWVLRTELPEKHLEMVIRSMLTLKLLTYDRTGAVIAAPTTSLPEIIGRDRNWDYRFCWVRDASMIIDLYVRMGHLQLATRYIHFILNRMLLKHDNIAVLYGINGEKELTEIELEHLNGYESSRPVRIGNDAWRQKQNDVYGELMETIYAYFFINHRTQMYLEEELWTVVCSLVKYIEDVWKEPDCGIWERRDSPKHYVHSKMMSWVALDRAGKIARFVGKMEYAQRCQEFAVQIKEDILTKGWNQDMQSFVMYYGAAELDASALLMLHYGFLDRKDPRMISTVKQIYKHLVKNDFVFRYMEPDGLGSPENAFIVCTFWMINALYLIGEEQKARQMFENMLTCANPSGLFSEHIEVTTHRLTGNFPQGYSHLAFIQTVLLLETDYNWSDIAGVKNWLADHEHRTPLTPRKEQ